jgi:diguanylate cyclase (GGDEF)-like protein/PAS domain S-box-containing protein
VSSRLRNLSDPESLREFARNLREGIYITTRDGRVLDANPAFLQMFGVRTVADLRGQNAGNLIVDAFRRAEQMELVDRDGSVREFEMTIKRPNGEVHTALNTCYLTRDAMTGEEFLHGILIDITARKALEAKLVEMSTHDELTGVLNRRHLVEVEKLFASNPDAHYGCIFVDIDHFKVYNDRYGHQSGDQVLVRMARFLMRHIRAEEAVLRVGGDEFVVLLNGADRPATELVADRLRAEALQTAPVPFSLGWASREPGESLARLLDRADQGLMAVRVEKRQSDPRDHPAIAGD